MTGKMIRTFHPVGQGAFYTERFYNEEQGKPVFMAVYDCGSVNVRQLKKAIDQTFGEDDIINLLFVSHFHSDHVNKIEYLKKRCQVKNIVIPVLTSGLVLESLVHDFIQSNGSGWNRNALQFLSNCINASYNNDGGDIRVVRVDVSGEGSEERQIIDLDSDDLIGPSVLHDTEIRFCDWIYVPYYIGDKYDELIAEFEANGFVFNLNLRSVGFLKEICEEIRKIGVDILKRIYGKGTTIIPTRCRYIQALVIVVKRHINALLCAQGENMETCTVRPIVCTPEISMPGLRRISTTLRLIIHVIGTE